MTISALAAGICVSGAGIHALSIGLAARRCACRPAKMRPPETAPGVTIVQPLCGVESFSRDTLRSIFALDYRDYEIIFCLASGDDPIAPLVRGVIAANPHRPARLLMGDDRISANPKLNNVVKGWKAARNEWIIIADSNVLMPSDYIQRLLARWQPETGIVCAPPIGSRAETFAAVIECGFLNTYEARWQYAGESFGFGFAQGKTMLWRRDILEAGGGIEALGAEIAEDAAATKLIHAQGLSAHLVDRPFQAAIDCSGRADAMVAALANLDRQGVLVLSGTGMVRPQLDHLRIILHELVVTGSLEYSRVEFQEAIDLLASGRLPVARLVEPDDVPLSAVADAMLRLAGGELAGKVMVVPRA